MQNDKKEITIKDFLTHYPSLVIMGIVAILSLYIGSMLNPIDARVSLIEKDVRVNAKDISDLQEIKTQVTENSVKLDEVLKRLDKIDMRLHDKN